MACKLPRICPMNASMYHAQTSRWTARRKNIRALAAAGIQLSVIARRYRISPARVHQIVYPKGKKIVPEK